MSNEVAIDDDLLIKSYSNAQLEPLLAERMEAIKNNCSDEALDDCSTKSEMGDETAEEVTFNVGDFVRCTYDDGIDYEAKILYINAEKNTCRIRYVGYENEQTVQMDALITTWGEEARATQYATAKAEELAATEVGKQSQTNYKNKTPKGFNPPPVPPIPPMLFDSEDEEKNQQFAQLLISWFMTGYYTGLHQRNMQDSKKFKN